MRAECVSPIAVNEECRRDSDFNEPSGEKKRPLGPGPVARGPGYAVGRFFVTIAPEFLLYNEFPLHGRRSVRLFLKPPKPIIGAKRLHALRPGLRVARRAQHATRSLPLLSLPPCTSAIAAITFRFALKLTGAFFQRLYTFFQQVSLFTMSGELPAALETVVRYATYLAKLGTIQAEIAQPYFSAINTVHAQCGLPVRLVNTPTHLWSSSLIASFTSVWLSDRRRHRGWRLSINRSSMIKNGCLHHCSGEAARKKNIRQSDIEVPIVFKAARLRRKHEPRKKSKAELQTAHRRKMHQRREHRLDATGARPAAGAGAGAWRCFFGGGGGMFSTST